MKTYPVLLLIMVFSATWAQDQKHSLAGQAASVASIETAANDIPAYHLDFKAQDPIPGVTASPVMFFPMQCASDGAIFMDMLAAPEFKEHLVYSISAKEARQFSLKNISDLHDVRFLSFFPSDSLIGFLVYATKDSEPSSRTLLLNGTTEAGKITVGEHHYYIAMFDRSGNYRESVLLPVDYPIFHFAILPSSNLIISGFDDKNNVPRLLLLNSRGGLLRPLQLPVQIQNESVGAGDPTHSALAASQTFGRILFTSHGSSVLLLQPGTTFPVLEIKESGSVREIPVTAPKGYVLDASVSSNDRWIIEFKRSGLSDDAAVDARPESNNYVFYEINQSDGSLQRRLIMNNGDLSWMACEHDGTMTALKTDQKLNLIPLTAQL
jgi:hypothetical protein